MSTPCGCKLSPQKIKKILAAINDQPDPENNVSIGLAMKVAQASLEEVLDVLTHIEEEHDAPTDDKPESDDRLCPEEP